MDGQAVYNANKYAKHIKKRETLQNWLDYYQMKYERHPEKRPIGRVFALILSFAIFLCSSVTGSTFWYFLCCRQDALVSVAGRWTKSTTTGLESATLRRGWAWNPWCDGLTFEYIGGGSSFLVILTIWTNAVSRSDIFRWHPSVRKFWVTEKL